MIPIAFSFVTTLIVYTTLSPPGISYVPLNTFYKSLDTFHVTIGEIHTHVKRKTLHVPLITWNLKYLNQKNIPTTWKVSHKTFHVKGTSIKNK